MKFSDNQIIEGIATGSSDILRMLYTHKDYFGKVYTHVLKNSGNTDEVNDVFQISLMRVHQNIINQKYQPNKKIAFKWYFFVVAKNTWKEHLRVKKKMPTQELSNWMRREDETFESLSYELVMDEDYQDIHQALAQLGEKCRTLIKRRYFEEERFIDIAKGDKVLSSTLRTRHSRCVKKLKTIFFSKKETNESK